MPLAFTQEDFLVKYCSYFITVAIFTETETAVASHYHFDALSGRLMALYNDIDDSALTFAYSNSGLLERVTSSEGYELGVLYNDADLVDSITLKKQGQDVNFATYAHLAIIRD